MRIDKLEVKGFGKLTGRTVFFKNGINIIYGNNETGKTTLQWFIKGMLYGLKNTRQSRKGLLLHKRFEPWEGGQYGGALNYTLDDGIACRVERNFDSGAVQLFDSYFNNITGLFDTGRDKMPMFAERQLGLDEVTFDRTVLIRQMEIRLDDDSAAALAGRLANANSTGFEEISFGRAEKALTEALRNSVGTDRTTTQPMDKLEARLKQLEAELGILQSKQKQRYSTREELAEIQNRSSRLEAKKRFLEHIGELIEVRKALDINLKREAGLKEVQKNLKEALKNLKELEGEPEGEPEGELKGEPEGIRAGEEHSGAYLGYTAKERLTAHLYTSIDSERRTSRRKKKSRKTPVTYMIAAALFAILLGYAAVTPGIGSSWPAPLVYSAAVLFAGIAGVLALRKVFPHKAGLAAPPASGIGDSTAVRAVELRLSVKNIYSSASVLCERQVMEPSAVKQGLKDVAAKLEELSLRLEQGLEQGIVEAEEIACYTAGLFTMKELDTVFYDMCVTGLEEAWRCEMDNVKKDLFDAALKEKYCEGMLEEDKGDSDPLQRVEEETVAVKEKIAYLKHKGNALKLAHEVLLEAGLEIKRTFAPGLDSRLSSIITGLTAGRYMELKGDDRLALKVIVPESGDIKSALLLSGAATDQMYLALRLAMAGLLTENGENLPLIMDEVFSQFDDKRTALALKYIHNAYEKKQVLIFTCKQREVELAQEICGSSLNLVELRNESS